MEPENTFEQQQDPNNPKGSPETSSVAKALQEILDEVRSGSDTESKLPNNPEEEYTPTKEDLEAEYFEKHFDERLALHYMAHAWERLPSEQKMLLAKKYGHYDGSQEGEPTLSEHHESVAMRPSWQELLPKDDSTQEQERWESVLVDFPEQIASDLDSYRVLVERQREILSDSDVATSIRAEKHKSNEIKRQASLYGAIVRRAETARTRAEEISSVSAQLDLPPTKYKEEEVSRLNREAEELERHAKSLISEEVASEIFHRQVLADRQALSRGLIETDQVKDINRRYIGSLIAGRPMLLVGETGGAKTQIAKNLARKVYGFTHPYTSEQGVDPWELISGHKDINSYQIMGKMELSKEDGVTVTNFAPGPMLRAMREGKPLIIDEINGISADVLKRLNEIFLLRPGQTLKVQENGGESIEVKEGFCIIGTANDKPSRYKGIEELSVEFKNRFGPRVERVHYPDSDKGATEFPTELFRIAMASLVDKYGQIDLDRLGLDLETLDHFLRMAKMSQHLFSEEATKADSEFVSDRQINDKGKTGLDQEVISPRVMVEMLQTDKQSAGKLTLQEVLRTYVDSIKPSSALSNDKNVMEALLKHFLLDSQEARLEAQKAQSEQQAQATLEHLTELLGPYASEADLEITTNPETGLRQVVAHGYLKLEGLTSAEGLKLPVSVAGTLYLNGLTSAEGLKLPDSIGRDLNLNSLTSAEGLELPDSVGGGLWLDGLTPEARQDLRQSRPDLANNILPNP